MKKISILFFTLFTTSALAGNNIMSLTPNNLLNLTPSGANNVAFESIAIQPEHTDPKTHKPNIDKVAKGKGKLTNKLEQYHDFTIDDKNDDDVLIDDNGDVVVITTDPREWKGIEEGGWVPELEPRCACIGIEHVGFEVIEHPPED